MTIIAGQHPSSMMRRSVPRPDDSAPPSEARRARSAGQKPASRAGSGAGVRREGLLDNGMGFVLNAAEVIPTLEALRIDPVDVFGA